MTEPNEVILFHRPGEDRLSFTPTADDMGVLTVTHLDLDGDVFDEMEYTLTQAAWEIIRPKLDAYFNDPRSDHRCPVCGHYAVSAYHLPDTAIVPARSYDCTACDSTWQSKPGGGIDLASIRRGPNAP